jgi:hypothetical protein
MDGLTPVGPGGTREEREAEKKAFRDRTPDQRECIQDRDEAKQDLEEAKQDNKEARREESAYFDKCSLIDPLGYLMKGRWILDAKQTCLADAILEEHADLRAKRAYNRVVRAQLRNERTALRAMRVERQLEESRQREANERRRTNEIRSAMEARAHEELCARALQYEREANRRRMRNEQDEFVRNAQHNGYHDVTDTRGLGKKYRTS